MQVDLAITPRKEVGKTQKKVKKGKRTDTRRKPQLSGGAGGPIEVKREGGYRERDGGELFRKKKNRKRKKFQ